MRRGRAERLLVNPATLVLPVLVLAWLAGEHPGTGWVLLGVALGYELTWGVVAVALATRGAREGKRREAETTRETET